MENNYKTPKPSNYSQSQIEQLARAFSKKINYNYTNGNIFESVKKNGGVIDYYDNPKDPDNASITVEKENSFTIKISNFTNPELRIMAIAHELGHYVLHSKLGEIQIKASLSKDNSLVEQEADIFANEFLMPESDIKKAFEKNKSIYDLASKFSVSILTMYLRCSTLGLLNEAR